MALNFGRRGKFIETCPEVTLNRSGFVGGCNIIAGHFSTTCNLRSSAVPIILSWPSFVASTAAVSINQPAYPASTNILSARQATATTDGAHAGCRSFVTISLTMPSAIRITRVAPAAAPPRYGL